MQFVHDGKQYNSANYDAKRSYKESEGKAILKEFFNSECYDFDISVDEDLRSEGFFGGGEIFTLYATKKGNFFVVFFGTRNGKKEFMVLDKDHVYRYLEAEAAKEAKKDAYLCWAKDWLPKYFSIEEA